MRRLSIPLEDNEHRRIKLLATLQGKSIKDYVLDRLLSEKTLNEETLQAIEDVEQDRDLTVYSGVEELMNKFKDEDN